MDLVLFQVAIFQLISFVLNTILYTQPSPAFHPLCLDFCVHKVNNRLHQCPSVNNGFAEQSYFLQSFIRTHGPYHMVCSNSRSVLHHFTNDHLKCLNKQYSISNSLINCLSEFKILSQDYTCPAKKKKFKRGSRGGRRKQQKIKIISNVFSSNVPSPHRHSVPNNLILIDTNPDPIDKSTRFKVLLLNAQSTRRKAHLLNDLVKESNSDIAFLTESWLSPIGDEPTFNHLTPEGYTSISFPRDHRRGGGIFITYRRSLNIAAHKLNNYNTFESCECHVQLGNKPIIFICVYRPPRSKKNKFSSNEFFSEFQSLIDYFNMKKIRPIVIGDFNFHYDIPTDADVIKAKSMFSASGLTQIVNKPTHIKNHILDWIVTDISSRDLIRNLSVEDKCLSDHFVITFEMDRPKPRPPKRTISTRKIDIDQKTFAADIQNTIPTIVLNSSADKVDVYNSKMAEILDRHAPLRTREVTDRPSAPWMTLEIKQAKSERRRAERKWRLHQITVNRELYKNCCNIVKKLIYEAKHAFYNAQINECPTSKMLFNVVKTVSGKVSKHLCLPKDISPMELPNSFGQYFCEKISSIRGKLDSLPQSSPIFEQFDGESMSKFQRVSQDDVKSIIMSSSPKTCCLDPIPTKLLITHLDSLIEVITAIINDSLQAGIVPRSFKHAVVIPLLKKMNLSPDEFKNYRPVSNLSFFYPRSLKK